MEEFVTSINFKDRKIEKKINLNRGNLMKSMDSLSHIMINMKDNIK